MPTDEQLWYKMMDEPAEADPLIKARKKAQEEDIEAAAKEEEKILKQKTADILRGPKAAAKSLVKSAAMIAADPLGANPEAAAGVVERGAEYIGKGYDYLKEKVSPEEVVGPAAAIATFDPEYWKMSRADFDAEADRSYKAGVEGTRQYTAAIANEFDDLPRAMQQYATDFNFERPDLVRRLRNVQPNDTVTIYRAISADDPAASIRPGDWVALDKSYAESHGASRYGDVGSRIVEMEVPAREVIWAGTSADEWHYAPEASRNSAVKSKHEAVVRQAVREGKPVPASVLSDYPDLVRAAAPRAPKYLFHSAPIEAIESIAAEGLDPSRGGSTFAHGAYGTTSRGKVHLSDNFDAARDWHDKVENILFDRSDDPRTHKAVMLRVSPQSTEIDPIGSGDIEGSRFTQNMVDASEIEFFDPDKGWRPVSEWQGRSVVPDEARAQEASTVKAERQQAVERQRQQAVDTDQARQAETQTRKAEWSQRSVTAREAEAARLLAAPSPIPGHSLLDRTQQEILGVDASGRAAAPEIVGERRPSTWHQTYRNPDFMGIDEIEAKLERVRTGRPLFDSNSGLATQAEIDAILRARPNAIEQARQQGRDIRQFDPKLVMTRPMLEAKFATPDPYISSGAPSDLHRDSRGSGWVWSEGGWSRASVSDRPSRRQELEARRDRLQEVIRRTGAPDEQRRTRRGHLVLAAQEDPLALRPEMQYHAQIELDKVNKELAALAETEAPRGPNRPKRGGAGTVGTVGGLAALGISGVLAAKAAKGAVPEEVRESGVEAFYRFKGGKPVEARELDPKSKAVQAFVESEEALQWALQNNRISEDAYKQLSSLRK